jgi:selenide,water dikinase
MQGDAPITRDVLLIGGGHAHAIVLRRWGMAPLPGARLTLVNPEPSVLYTGMLPGYVAGHYRREELAIDLVKLARFAGARLVLDRVIGLDPTARTAALAGRPPIEFDIASIDIGVTSHAEGLEGLRASGAPAKPMAAFAAAWEAFVEAVDEGEKLAAATVIGAGVGGVELAMAMARRLRRHAPPGVQVRVTLIEREATIAPQSSPAARALMLSALERSGVRVVTGAAREDIEDAGAGFVAQAAGARPAPWLATTKLALAAGFVRVDRCLRSVSHPWIFAAGDVASVEGAGRAKAGVYAVRQAPVLHRNLLAAVAGGALRAFRPQRDHLKLISLGEKTAVAEKWGLALRHPAIWTIKDLIDRRFMARFDELPAMTRAAPRRGPAALGVAEMEAADPLCGGCGSKLGAQELASGLASLTPTGRSDVLRGAGDDAAVLAWGPGATGRAQVITTDHFRAFTLDPYLMARIVTQHALGDVWAMGAAPQAALASIVLPPMSPDKQSATLREILAAMQQALGEAGADLVGGHTSQGAELTLGLTVTGLAAERPPIGLDGAAVGDALILTKPIGVGTVLAGEMRGLAKGEWVAAALGQMGRPCGDASALLRAHAHAMTDVTGFGLAGHLRGMMAASDVRAEIWLEEVPWAAGAVDLVAVGVRSSLFPQNSMTPVETSEATRADPRFALLFDPQTAGGLIAAVPRAAAPALLAAFAAAGEPAWEIGRVRAAALPSLVVRLSREQADD